MTVRSKAGFSLTELTVVLAIILIVSGLSFPSLARVIDMVRVKTAAQQLFTSRHVFGPLRMTPTTTSYLQTETAAYVWI